MSCILVLLVILNISVHICDQKFGLVLMPRSSSHFEMGRDMVSECDNIEIIFESCLGGEVLRKHIIGSGRLKST